MITRRSVLGAVLAAPVYGKQIARNADPLQLGTVAGPFPSVGGASPEPAPPELQKLFDRREELWRQAQERRQHNDLTPLRAAIHDKRSWSNAFKVMAEIEERKAVEDEHRAAETALERMIKAYRDPVGAILKGDDL
ncbi:MAG: hypothetical protein AAFU68_02790 [Pseudomonadota bacterium]